MTLALLLALQDGLPPRRIVIGFANPAATFESNSHAWYTGVQIGGKGGDLLKPRDPVERIAGAVAQSHLTVALAATSHELAQIREGERYGKLVSTGPAIDSRECLGAIVSNGRIIYTSQASGLQVSQVAGADARSLGPVWERK